MSDVNGAADVFIARVAVVALASVAVAIVVGGMILVAQDKTLPDALIAIGAGAVGALATLVTGLVTGRRRNGNNRNG